MRAVFVHGACVQDGAWWWHPTGAVLAAQGVASAAPRLPSCGETSTDPGHAGPGLDADVAAVRAALGESSEPTVVIAHSYGGIVAAEAVADMPSVRHLVLVASYLPEPGESLSSFGPDEPAPFLEIDTERAVFTVRADSLAETFLHDCAPELRHAAASKTAWQSLAVLQAPVRIAGWTQVPTTYLVCVEDRGTPASAQRAFAERADRVVELPTGHHPFLADPAAMSALVVDLLER